MIKLEVSRNINNLLCCTRFYGSAHAPAASIRSKGCSALGESMPVRVGV